jgi:C4-type Zn-finger protein
MEFDCKFKINSEQENINLVATDENGNTAVIYNGPVKYVDPLKLDCNQIKIEDEGIIECKTNRKVKYTIEVDNKKESKEGADIFIYKIENQENKKYPISVKVEDEQGLKQEYVKEVEVDKGVFDAKMWVVKSEFPNQSYNLYSVYAQATKDADFEATYVDTIYGYSSGDKKVYQGGSGRAKIFARSDLPKDQEILVKTDKSYYTGCVDKCAQRNFEIKIYSTKNPNKTIFYKCKSAILLEIIVECNKQ